ncbi:MAG TPA: hypothetical protein PLH94_07005 [Fimbriimonadaceae bacterium]|nr:hypothetical protein [Fimbriimonadaceae bacterium]
MRYYVIARDGRKFGPADLETLSQWALEGRVARDTYLEDEFSGERIRAGEVVGINFPPAAPLAPPTDWSKPPEFGVGNTATVGTNPGSNELALAWVFAVLSIVLCFAYGCLAIAFGPLALYFAKKAEANGANATGPRVVAWIAIGLGTLFVLAMVVLFTFAFSAG